MTQLGTEEDPGRTGGAATAREAPADGRLRSAAERLQAFASALQPTPHADRGEGNDPGAALLQQADIALLASGRLAALLDEPGGGWDAIDQAIAAALLSDLAASCHALRQAASVVSGRLRDASDAIQRNRGDLARLELDGRESPSRHAEPGGEFSNHVPAKT